MKKYIIIFITLLCQSSFSAQYLEDVHAFYCYRGKEEPLKLAIRVDMPYDNEAGTMEIKDKPGRFIMESRVDVQSKGKMSPSQLTVYEAGPGFLGYTMVFREIFHKYNWDTEEVWEIEGKLRDPNGNSEKFFCGYLRRDPSELEFRW